MLAALIGGLGKVRGAVLGGIALGVAEVLLQKYAGAQYRSLLSYLGLVCLLCIFPRRSALRFNA
jgi:branched-subunit amino acid ABC-type transport system permease component